MKKKLLILIIISIGIYYFYPTKKLGNHEITKIEVYKHKRKLIVYAGSTTVNKYTISLGFQPKGKKMKEGDEKTPEGNYYIDAKNDKSSCYKNLGVSYPNASDRANNYTGGLIKIHGILNGFGWVGKFHRFYDWTNGCMAVTNQEMEELYRHVPVGTPLIIYP